MSKKKVFELARDIGISSKELISELNKIDINVKSHMSILENVESILDKLTAGEKKQVSEIVPEKQELKEIKKDEIEEQVPGVKIEKPVLKINEEISTSELAKKLKVSPAILIKKLIEIGKMVTINQKLDNDTITIIADEYGFQAEIVPIFEDEAILLSGIQEERILEKRSAVVTMMGHVDHGKTSLLDAIRKTNVVSGEAGGITQHIGAYTVKLDKGNVTFLDTPGHKAFTAMRARGAKVTDIVVLVVAADDGVMPQTIEAIDHAKDAGVSIIVAINKIDTPSANTEKVKQELSKYGLIPEEWGGKTVFVEVSAKKEIGLSNLLEMIILSAEILELTADPKRKAVGTIIESRLDKGRGPVATVLIADGTLKSGDCFIAGLTYGKVRAMINDRGEKIKDAGPSMPVEVLGFSSVSSAGDKFIVVADEKTAKDINLKRQEKHLEKKIHPVRHISLDELYNEIQKGKIKELKIIIKADVQGSVEPLRESLEQISNEKVKLISIHSGVGNINESDVMLAAASDAIIIGFHVIVDQIASKLAVEEGVDIRLYEIIYEVVSDVKSAMEGLLEPATKEVVSGKAEIRKVIKLAKEGVIIGAMVLTGKITRTDNIRVLRKNETIFTGKISSLRRFKDDVKDVSVGYECGIGVENFTDLHEQDIIESFTIEKVKQKL